MPLQLKPRIEQTFVLEKSDAEFGTEGTTVTIKQATQGEHEKRQDLYATLRSIYGGDSGALEMVQRFNTSELHRHEARLTMTDCNILDEEGNQLFKTKKDKKGTTYIDMTDVEFGKAWSMLPVIVTEEIHEKVLELNKLWSSKGE